MKWNLLSLMYSSVRFDKCIVMPFNRIDCIGADRRNRFGEEDTFVSEYHLIKLQSWSWDYHIELTFFSHHLICLNWGWTCFFCRNSKYFRIYRLCVFSVAYSFFCMCFQPFKNIKTIFVLYKNWQKAIVCWPL